MIQGNDETAALIKLLNEKMGQTDYHYRTNEFTNQVWYKNIGQELFLQGFYRSGKEQFQ
jgi:hypothetical protein